MPDPRLAWPRRAPMCKHGSRCFERKACSRAPPQRPLGAISPISSMPKHATRLPRVVAPLCLLASACLAFAADAQTYPVKPVQIVVPFAVGGAADVTVRVVAQKLGERMGQSESGFPGYSVSSWNGIAAPAGTPRVIIERLNSEINAVVAM